MGNSGGPALIESQGNNREVAGVAFQTLSGADNIGTFFKILSDNFLTFLGYIIPPPVISHFLTQIHMHKKYTCSVFLQIIFVGTQDSHSLEFSGNLWKMILSEELIN